MRYNCKAKAWKPEHLGAGGKLSNAVAIEMTRRCLYLLLSSWISRVLLAPQGAAVPEPNWMEEAAQQTWDLLDFRWGNVLEIDWCIHQPAGLDCFLYLRLLGFPIGSITPTLGCTFPLLGGPSEERAAAGVQWPHSGHLSLLLVFLSSCLE